MRIPSKRTAAIAEQEAIRKQAFNENDVEKFAAAATEIKRLEAEPDVYTCADCGDDFGDGPHMELLIAAVTIYGEDGRATERYDYGVNDVRKGAPGRRVKICGPCMNEWSTAMGDYLESRSGVPGQRLEVTKLQRGPRRAR